jgi:hypothetical protein
MRNLYRYGLACLTGCVVISVITPILAQESEPQKAPSLIASIEEDSKITSFFKGVEINGFIDTYYSYNFSKPDDQIGSTPVFTRDADEGDWLDVRAFDRENNSFTLDNVEIAIFKPSTEKDPIGFGFITNYGEIAQRLTFVSSDGRVDDDDFTVSQGFVTYKAQIGKGLDFKFGKFASWIGAELCQSVDNPNFSRSLLFENAITWTNTGLGISYPLLDSLTTSFYLVNGWDTFVDNNDSKTLGYQFNWNVGENTNFIVNGSHGAEQDEDMVADADNNLRHFWDCIFAIKPFSKTTFNLNFVFGTEESGANDVFGKDTAEQRLHYKTGKWWGFSGIVNQDVTDSFGLALRGEYFDDNDGARRGVDSLQIWEITLTVNIKVGERLLIRPEVRYDKADLNIFNGHNGEVTTAIDLAYIF